MESTLEPQDKRMESKESELREWPQSEQERGYRERDYTSKQES